MQPAMKKPTQRKTPDYLWERPNTDVWWFSRAVPKHLWVSEGRRAIQHSLGTKDRGEAVVLARRYASQLDERWGQRAKPDTRIPTDDEMEAAAFKHTHAHLIEYEDVRRREARRHGGERWQRHLQRSAINKDAQAQHTDLDEYAMVKSFADAIIDEEGFNLVPGSDGYKRLCDHLNWVRLDALNVSQRRAQGNLEAETENPRLLHIEDQQRSGKTDIPFAQLVNRYMASWQAERTSGKQTNTPQQKLSTFKLFGGYWSNKAIRSVLEQDVTAFRDQLKLLAPNWSRAPSARNLGWAELIREFGDHPVGLSHSTMNRHMATLQSLWDWASRRGHCEGDNPFSGFHTKLKGPNAQQPYRAWEDAELAALFDPPPKRSDLLEVMLVGLFSGMRLNEIASLTWSHLRLGERDIHYFEIEDAKTPAGIRQVPVHSELRWLLVRKENEPSAARIWPKFNDEGPSSKPGADASREFSRFKAQRGFTDRLKTFHSFRKNVTRIMERARVAENEWAQVFGHERNFTYRVYNPDGIALSQKAEIIERISYPGVALPHPEK
jgi:integrase